MIVGVAQNRIASTFLRAHWFFTHHYQIISAFSSVAALVWKVAFFPKKIVSKLDSKLRWQYCCKPHSWSHFVVPLGSKGRQNGQSEGNNLERIVTLIHCIFKYRLFLLVTQKKGWSLMLCSYLKLPPLLKVTNLGKFLCPITFHLGVCRYGRF